MLFSCLLDVLFRIRVENTEFSEFLANFDFGRLPFDDEIARHDSRVHRLAALVDDTTTLLAVGQPLLDDYVLWTLWQIAEFLDDKATRNGDRRLLNIDDLLGQTRRRGRRRLAEDLRRRSMRTTALLADDKRWRFNQLTKNK